MKTRTAGAALALGLCLVWALQARTAAAERIPSERRLPKGVLAYVSLHDVSDLKAQWAKTLYGRLAADDSLRDFRNDLEKSFEELARQMEEEIGLSPAELFAIPQGEIALAVVPLPEDKIGGVLFLDFGDRKDAVEKLLDKAAEALDRQHARRTEDEIDETRIVTYQIDDDADAADGEDSDDLPSWLRSFGYFLKDSFLVLGTDAAALKEVLSRWDGKHEHTLSENEVFRYVIDRCREGDAPPQMAWFVDPIAMLRGFALGRGKVRAEALGPRAPGIDQMLAVLRNLGIDKFRGVGGTFDMARGEYDMVSRTLVYLEPPAKGILELAHFDLTHQSPPKWLSSEWTGYTSVNWSLARAYSTIEAAVDLIQGPGFVARMVDILAENEAFGKIHLKNDLFDQLPGPIHIAEDDSAGPQERGGGTLVAFALRDPGAFRTTLAKLAQLGRGVGKINEREFQGETIYDIEVPQAPAQVYVDDDETEADADAAAPRHLGVAVAENHLMFATDVRMLERVLRGVQGRETLADSASYGRVAKRFPPQTASISYSRQDSQFRMLYELLKSGQSGLVFEDLGKLDFSRLPPFDALKKYMPESGSFMEPDARGLRITSFSLQKEGD